MVEKNGGFEDVTSHNLWDTIFQEKDFSEILTQGQAKNMKELYEQYLFHFEKTCSMLVFPSLLEKYEKKLENLVPSFLSEVQTYSYPKNTFKDPLFLAEVL